MLFNYSIYVTNAPPKKPDVSVGFFAVKREILAQSKYDCARLCRRTLRCTLHYASKLARSR